MNMTPEMLERLELIEELLREEEEYHARPSSSNQCVQNNMEQVSEVSYNETIETNETNETNDTNIDSSINPKRKATALIYLHAKIMDMIANKKFKKLKDLLREEPTFQKDPNCTACKVLSSDDDTTDEDEKCQCDWCRDDGDEDNDDGKEDGNDDEDRQSCGGESVVEIELEFNEPEGGFMLDQCLERQNVEYVENEPVLENAEYVEYVEYVENVENEIEQNAVEVDDDEPLPMTDQRPSCRFGRDCIKKSYIHRRREAHPIDKDYQWPVVSVSASGIPNCPYAELCHRLNPLHHKKFSHPPNTDYVTNYKIHRMRLRKNMEDDYKKLEIQQKSVRKLERRKRREEKIKKRKRLPRPNQPYSTDSDEEESNVNEVEKYNLSRLFHDDDDDVFDPNDFDLQDDDGVDNDFYDYM